MRHFQVLVQAIVATALLLRAHGSKNEANSLTKARTEPGSHIVDAGPETLLCHVVVLHKKVAKRLQIGISRHPGKSS